MNKKTAASDVIRQRRKLYTEANILLFSFCYCANDVKDKDKDKDKDILFQV